MRDVPASVIETWPAPNYINPETRGQALVVVNTALLLLVLVVFGLRIHTRIHVKRWSGVDDVCLGFATISAIGLAVCVILADVRYGWSRHTWDVPPNLMIKSAQTAFAAKLLFAFSSTLTRISILLFYYRLVRDAAIEWFLYAVHILMALSVAIFVTFAALCIWQCNPIEAYWQIPRPAAATCMNEGEVLLIAGIINSLADFAVTLLPIPLIMRLRIPIRERIGAAVLLGLGFAVSVAGGVRTYFVWLSMINQWDQNWYAYGLWIAVAVEIDLGVICASAAALRPLIVPPRNRVSTFITAPPDFAVDHVTSKRRNSSGNYHFLTSSSAIASPTALTPAHLDKESPDPFAKHVAYTYAESSIGTGPSTSTRTTFDNSTDKSTLYVGDDEESKIGTAL